VTTGRCSDVRARERPAGLTGLRRWLVSILVCALVGCGEAQPPAGTHPFRVTEAMRNSAVAAYDRQALRSALDAIVSWHRKNGTAIPASLRPGLTDPEIDALLEKIGCKPPRELRELWKWRDGHKDTATAEWLVWYHQLLPVEEVVREYRFLRSRPDLAWGKNWLPVLSFEKEWYFVECDAAERTASPLMFYFTETGPAPAYVNLTTFFTTAAQSMAEGAVYVTGQPPLMECDIRRVSEIHRAHNPGLPFPYYVSK